MSEQKVIWLEDKGEFEDQFGTKQDCTYVRQQVVITKVDERTKKGGYGQPVHKYYYEDPMGRRFLFLNRGISFSGPGRTYQHLGDEEFEGTWKEPKKLDRNAPYITPDGENKVEIIDTDHDTGYEFYESTQMSL